MTSYDEEPGSVRAAFADLFGAENGQNYLIMLWNMGFTVIKRQAQPLNIPAHMIPHGMAYQWMNVCDVQDKTAAGWAPVPASRHNGIFRPADFEGDITIDGNALMERPAREVEAEKAEAPKRVQKQIDDWARHAHAGGLSGGVRAFEGDQLVYSRKIGDPAFARQLQTGFYESGMTKLSARELDVEIAALVHRGIPEDERPLLAIRIIKGRKLHAEYERTHR